MANIPPGQPPIIPPLVPVPPVQVAPRPAPSQQLPAGQAPIGQVTPPLGASPTQAPSPPLVAGPRDARTAALRMLGDYITGIPFTRVGAVGESAPRPFPLARKNFLLAPPEHEVDLVFPSIVCLDGQIVKVPMGFAVQPDEATRDAFGAGTVLVPQWTHDEVVPLEVWGSRAEEVRCVMAGIEQYLSPTEGIRGLVLVLPDYFNQAARYTYEGDEWPGDMSEIVAHRRRGIVRIRMEVDVVRLVSYVPMTPITSTDVEPTGSASPLIVPRYP